MENQDYHATFSVSKPANEAFKSINSVSKWWTENLEGSSKNLNDVFTVRFGGDAFVTHKVVDVVPDEKVVWLVTDCYLPWLNHKTEWTNTKMSFEIRPENSATTIRFTHLGLVPDAECYDSCVKGWDQYVKGSLLNLITEGEGQPQRKVQ